MNILFIANFRQNSGWSIASREYIQALSVTPGVNLTIRPVYVGSSTDNLTDPLFAKLENTVYDRYDAVIYNTLPSALVYDKNFGKNISLVHLETEGWINDWPAKLKMMDTVIVPSEFSWDCLYNSTGINGKIVNIPCDIEKFNKKYNGPIPKDFIKDKFVFYYLGDWTHRKHLELVLRAYHTEFSSSEHVTFVAKVSKQGLSSTETIRELKTEITNIKESLRIYPKVEDYKDEILIGHRMTDDEICGLHQQCDAFILPSAGESWSIPATDALGFGNQVITTRTGFYYDRPLLDNRILPVDSTKDYISTSEFPLRDLYTGREKWQIPNLSSLCCQMRKAYEQGKTKYNSDMSWVSYETIGRRFKEEVESIL